MLEGLPINQYREVEVTIGPNSLDNKPVDKDGWPELPMPRDSHMLPEHSQQLLRAARSGRLLKPPAPPEDDNEMKDEEEEPKEVQSGFTVKKYVKVARHLETTEPEYLAKRRKGLPSPYVHGQNVQTALRETKVKKLDAEGNVAVYKVLVPEGQAVEGEVQPSDAAIEVIPATAVPGTIVEGVGVVNAEGVVVAGEIAQPTPPRRRNPPPKKKRPGPGRKKRVGFVDGGAGQGTPASSTGIDSIADAIKREGDSVAPSDGGDTPMGEAGADEDEASGEDGSDDEEQDADRNSTPATPLKPASTVLATAPTSIPDMDLSKITDTTPSEILPDAKDPAIATVQSPEPPAEDKSTVLPMHLPAKTESSLSHRPSKSPDLPISVPAQSRQSSSDDEITTAPPTADTQTSQPTSTEPVLATSDVSIEATDVQMAEKEIVATPAPVSASEPTPESSAVAETEVATAPPDVPSPPAPSAPPSEPDLLGSLEAQLEKDEKDLAQAQ